MPDPEIFSAMLTEMRRGTLSLAVLSRLKKPQYGYSLLQSLEQKGIRIEAGTLYPLLRRLETQGLLENQWDTATARPRKYYVLNAEGAELYRALKREWEKTCEEMRYLLEEDE